MKKTIRLNKSGLRNLIRESVKRALMETELTYDVDNFSGRWNKTEPNMDNFVDPEGYLDDPNHNPHHDEEWDEYVDDFGGDAKAAEEDYSWNLHDTQPVAPGVGGRYNVFSKHGVARDIDDAIAINNRRLYGDEKAKDRISKRARTKWINGKNSPEDIEDWTNDMRFTRPEAFGESKLRNIVKETINNVLKEGYKAGEWNEDIFRSDLRAYIEMSRDYDGSAGYANAKGRKMNEVIGDLPWGVNGREFEMWLVTHGSFKADQIDQMVDNAVDWVRNKLESRPKAPRIF